jgi:hypothetical protein
MSVKPKKTGKSKPLPSQASSSGNQKLWQNAISLAAVFIMLMASISRIVLSHIPMSRDEGAYAYLGRLAARGFTPYVDFYEMKPPMLFYLYGLGGSVFGFTDIGLRLFALLLNLCSSVLIFLILRYYMARHYALVAAALFAVFSLNPFAWGFSMVAEHLVNTLVLSAFFLLHKSIHHKGYLFAILAGVAFAMAVLTKQTAVLISPVILLYAIVERKRKPWLAHCLAFAGGVLLPVIIIGVWLAMNGALGEALYWLTTYPAKYSTAVTPEEGKAFLRYFSKHITLFQLSLFIAFGAVFIAALAWIRRNPFHWMVAYFLIAALTIIPGFRFYGQYWMLIFAPIALMTGAAFFRLEEFKPRMGLIAATGVMILMTGEMIMHRSYYFNTDTPDEVSLLYKNNPFGPIRKLSRYAGAQMKAEDTFMVFGSEPQAYLYAGKDAPTRHVFMGMISKHDEKSKEFIREALDDLGQKQPTYVLYNFFMYSWGMTVKSNDELYMSGYNYLKNHYMPLAAYNMDSDAFQYTSEGQQINPSLANQVVLFKRK